jgi:hypothetical protein
MDAGRSGIWEKDKAACDIHSQNEFSESKANINRLITCYLGALTAD